MYILLTIFLVFLGTIALQSKKKDPEKIFGVYSQPGKWFYLKYYTFICILTLRKWKSKFIHSSSGLGNHVMQTADELERLQPLSIHEKAFDAVFFQGVNKRGYYFCGGLERRHEGKASGLFYIVVPGLGLLRSKSLPKTTLDQDPVSIHLKKKYAAEGIEFKPIEPMKTWRVAYNGKMSLKGDEDKLYDVKFEAEWHYDKFPNFMFDTQMNTKALARAIAREPWTKEFFDTLKAAHQTHYEQMGKLWGTLTVNGDVHKISMDSFRDHSFGHKRDWALMHRYAFHMMYLENGMRICLGVICQPCTTSHLEVGYIVMPDKTIHSIDSCDLLLYQHGEDGKPGKCIGFTFEANGDLYDVKVVTEYECEHFKGNDTEARLIERFNTYEVNDIKGKGIAEWQYNNLNKIL